MSYAGINLQIRKTLDFRGFYHTRHKREVRQCGWRTLNWRAKERLEKTVLPFDYSMVNCRSMVGVRWRIRPPGLPSVA